MVNVSAICPDRYPQYVSGLMASREMGCLHANTKKSYVCHYIGCLCPPGDGLRSGFMWSSLSGVLEHDYDHASSDTVLGLA